MTPAGLSKHEFAAQEMMRVRQNAGRARARNSTFTRFSLGKNQPQLTFHQPPFAFEGSSSTPPATLHLEFVHLPDLHIKNNLL
jgi:hypothetical protein